MLFSEIGLSSAVLRGVESRGHETPTEVQQRAIPLALTGQDIIACAPTGTGKTAAFVLPLLHRLVSDSKRNPAETGPHALVLTPTRELAEQITLDADLYGCFTNLETVTVIGGMSIGKQIDDLRQGCDILVATPGRLLDLMQRRCVHFTHVEFLVIDEADRMYDMGFIRDVRKIIARVPKTRQTMLFSATMSDEVVRLIREVAPNAHLVEVGERSRPVDTITQRFCSARVDRKIDLLRYLLATEPVDLMLVFSDTRRGADRIASHLKHKGINAHAIHADRTQDQRRKILEAFKARKFKVLVATDLAARGIDIEGVSHVVNFETPSFVEDYVHRIGRTGRAERSGIALTFVSEEEESFARKIGAHLGRPIELECFEGFDEPEPVRKPRLMPGFGRSSATARMSSNRSRRR